MIQRPQFSEAEKLQMRDIDLKRLWKGLFPKRLDEQPTIALERWRQPGENSVYADCMEEHGFPGRLLSDGTMEHQVPPEQNVAFKEATYNCHARLTTDPVFTREFTREQWQLLYDYTVQWWVPCARMQGWETSEPPSRDVWVTRKLDPPDPTKPDIWNPLVEVLAAYPVDQMQVEERCPAQPPTDILFGAER